MLKSTDKLISIFKELGRPYALVVHQEDNPPALPFFSYQIYTETMKADNVVVYKSEWYEVELVSEVIEFDLMDAFEQKLTEQGLAYSHTEPIWNATERTFIVIYTI